MKGKSSLILVIDDEVDIQRLVQQRFRKKIRAGELSFQFAQNGLEALQIVQGADDDIDMILTDIRMPDMDGLTLLSNLATLESSLKAVVVSAFGDMRNIRMAMNRGAFDFLTKPVDFRDLEITINKTLAFVSALRSQKQQLQVALDQLQRQAFYDQLTGLPNRNGLLQQIAQSFESKQKQGNHFALFMLDIEQYSSIKSGFGHAVSDRLIVEVARRLEPSIQASVILARIEANVFAILWYSLNSLDDVHDKVVQLFQQLASPLKLDEMSVALTTRIGVALSDLPYTQPDVFFQAADTAMQIARQQTSQNLVFFNIQMQATAIQRLNLEVALKGAIEADQLTLYYQPIFRLDTQKIVSFEVLIRWEQPTQEWLSPGQFIPLAEETGLIVPLGEWVLSEACHQLGRWQAELGDASPARISVNLSSLQLKSPTLVQHIDDSLKSAGLTGHALTLEITESVLMEKSQTVMKVLTQLRKRNIKLSMDDFGTHYSSLSYLQRLPINTLKIDKSFIQDIEVNPANFEITSTIINLAHNLALDVIAEGVEKEEHLKILKSLSCQCGQGFIFSRPLDVSAATALLKKQTAAL